MPLMPQPSRARWRLKCAIDAQMGVPCTDTNSVDYRAKQFAAQNAFCNAGDTSYPGSQCAAPTDRNLAIGQRRLLAPTRSVPQLASSSQRTWQKCLVCPLSTYPRQQLPKFKF